MTGETYGPPAYLAPGYLAPGETYGPPSSLAPNYSGSSGSGNMSTLGMTAQIAGSVIGAVGAFYAAQSQKDQIKSQALNAEHASRMAAISARQAETDALAIMSAGRYEIARMSMAAGQRKAQTRVSAASRGVVGNVGSAAEVQASEDIVKEMDINTINRNTVRAAGQARVRGTNARNQSLLSGVSAGNLRRTAGTIRPGLAFVNSSIASAGQFASQYARRG